MSDQMDINATLGESYEYGGRQPVIPGSYYPSLLTILSTGTSEAKTAYDDEGNEIAGGETPFVEICASVTDGPFAGSEVTRKAYITPGRKGGALGRWLGACHAITRQTAMTEVACTRFGIKLSNGSGARPVGKETAEQAVRRVVRQSLADGFYALDAATRLAFIATLLNVPQWDGKRCIVKLGVETSYKFGDETITADQYAKLDDVTAATVKTYTNNVFDGFIPLDHEKHGLAFVRAIEFPKQEATKALMLAQTAGA